MIVDFFVIQKNEKDERKDVFIGSKDLVFLCNGTYHNFDKTTYVVMEQAVHPKIVFAFCYENNEFINETHKKENDDEPID